MFLYRLGFDLFLLRADPIVRGLDGPHQICGRRDGRMTVVVCPDRCARQRLLWLPVAGADLDARFGYDGGRHDQIGRQLGASQVRPRELLLSCALFKR